MTNNEKIAEIRKIVERYDGQKPELIEISSADDAFVYQAKMANSQAVEVAKVLLAEIDRLQEENKSLTEKVQAHKHRGDYWREEASRRMIYFHEKLQAQQEIEKYSQFEQLYNEFKKSWMRYQEDSQNS